MQGSSFYADTHRGFHLTPGAYVWLRVVRGLAGIDSKRGIACRPAVTLARRSCLELGLGETPRVHAMNLENAAPASSGYPSCDLLHGDPAGASDGRSCHGPDDRSRNRAARSQRGRAGALFGATRVTRIRIA